MSTRRAANGSYQDDAQTESRLKIHRSSCPRSNPTDDPMEKLLNLLADGCVRLLLDRREEPTRAPTSLEAGTNEA